MEEAEQLEIPWKEEWRILAWCLLRLNGYTDERARLIVTALKHETSWRSAIDWVLESAKKLGWKQSGETPAEPIADTLIILLAGRAFSGVNTKVARVRAAYNLLNIPFPVDPGGPGNGIEEAKRFNQLAENALEVLYKGLPDGPPIT